MSKPEVEGRIMDLLKGFDKVGVRKVDACKTLKNVNNSLGQGYHKSRIRKQMSVRECVD